jgi:GNAT superfamily N-acetyltransferase
MSVDTRVRRLGPDDLPDLVDLATRVGWTAETRRYSFLLDVGEVYGLHDVDTAVLIGTVTLTRFEPSFATVGMMLVDPGHGGRGYGRQLMHHVLGVAGDVTVALFATSAGRPLYEKLGFETLAENHSHRGTYAGEASGMTEAAIADDLAAIIEVDRVVTGCDRGAMLETYAAFAEELRVKRDDGAVTGYGGRWRHGELHVIGPVIAADTDAAIALSADLASRANGEVRIEVGDERAELAAWANATGLVRSATTSVMTLGGRPLPGDRDRWFMPVTLAIG